MKDVKKNDGGLARLNNSIKARIGAIDAGTLVLLAAS